MLLNTEIVKVIAAVKNSFPQLLKRAWKEETLSATPAVRLS
jgi:hypothetical protein